MLTSILPPSALNWLIPDIIAFADCSFVNASTIPLPILRHYDRLHFLFLCCFKELYICSTFGLRFTGLRLLYNNWASDTSVASASFGLTLNNSGLALAGEVNKK